MNLPAIDVLRGLAALGVVWYHSRVDLWVGFREIQSHAENYSNLDRWLSWASLPVSQLSSLVMLFFVLSGFCIHLPQAKRGGMVDRSAYGIRRFFRIYPAYLVTLILCYVATVLLGLASRGEPKFESSYLWSTLLLQNWFADGGQIDLNPSLWSIPVEAEFYLVYPLLLLIFLHRGMRACLGFTLVCTSVGWILHFQGLSIAEGAFFKYAIIWNSGAWLAEKYMRGELPVWTKWHSTLMIFSVTVTPALGLVGADHFYLDYGWGLGAFLLLWWLITDGAGWLDEEARWVKPLTALGTISYSLYLIHFPLFKVGGTIWVEYFGSKPESFLVPTLATFSAIPFAWCFFKAFENPSHAWARQLAKRWASRAPARDGSNATAQTVASDKPGTHPDNETPAPANRTMESGNPLSVTPIVK
ncbi:acyltransferase family protein [Rhodopirellula sp. JC639]|uniref:acyltransferase family protein n=1 Tax=Stieleria mannarensis TaxID=2755585 RepID=UPI0016045C90